MTELSCPRPAAGSPAPRRLGDCALAEVTEDGGKPASHCISDRGQVGFQTVIAWHYDHLASRGGRRDPERIVRPLNDEGWHGDGVELLETALHRLVAASRWLEGKGKTENSNSPSCRGSTTGDTRSERSAPDDEPRISQPMRTQVLDDREPGAV